MEHRNFESKKQLGGRGRGGSKGDRGGRGGKGESRGRGEARGRGNRKQRTMNNGIANADGFGIYEDNYEQIDDVISPSELPEDNLSLLEKKLQDFLEQNPLEPKSNQP